jgi:hypothetical protein
MLFDLNVNEHQGTCLSDQDGTKWVLLPMAAFVDDANLIGNDDAWELTNNKLVK